jgi:tetratricopeptide (TPR) repeat protein
VTERGAERGQRKRMPNQPPPRSAAPRQIRPWESLGWTKETPEEPQVSGDISEVDPDAPVRKRDRSAKLPDTVAAEINKAVGARRGARISVPLLEASKAFERERYGDALKILRPLIEEAPDVPAVRELTGLCLYRQEKWAEAVRQLERFAELTGSVEQNPVLADCHRALKHYGRVLELWEELASSSPSADLVTEGRIVMAGTLADQGQIEDAIRILERAPSGGKRARSHHVRMWYALADLYERAGDVPRARDMFKRVAEHDPELADVSYRLANLA